MHAGLLFFEHFLTDGIRTTDAYRRLASDQPFARGIRRRLEEIYAQFPFQSSPDEAQTEQELIFRVLEVIGWDRDAWLVQSRAARKARSDVPDVLLFPDRDATEQANAETGKDRRFRHGLAIVESKRWDRPLDRAAKGAKQGRRRAGSTLEPDPAPPLTGKDAVRSRIQWAVLTAA